MTGGARAVHAIAAVAFLAASQAGDSSCQQATPANDVPRSQVCETDSGSIRTIDGYVVGKVTAKCYVPPREHVLEAWLEYSTSRWGGFTMPRFPLRDTTIPDTEGVTLWPRLPCKPGYYQTKWRIHGRGPAVPDHQNGIGFDEVDGDYGSTYIDADQCAG